MIRIDRRRNVTTLLSSAAATLVSATALAAPSIASDALTMVRLGTVNTGGAEISSYDPQSRQLYVTNAGTSTVSIVSLRDPASPAVVGTIDVSGFGSPNSVRRGPGRRRRGDRGRERCAGQDPARHRRVLPYERHLPRKRPGRRAAGHADFHARRQLRPRRKRRRAEQLQPAKLGRSRGHGEHHPGAAGFRPVQEAEGLRRAHRRLPRVQRQGSIHCARWASASTGRMRPSRRTSSRNTSP